MTYKLLAHHSHVESLALLLWGAYYYHHHP